MRLVNIGISGVQIDSSLGYTNYMIYQAEDTTIHGVNVTWGAENSTIAQTTNGPDAWVLASGGQNIHALRGTHLSITAITTPSKGAEMLTFFQETGNDMQVYQRDAFSTGGLWGPAPQNPVNNSTSS